MGAVEERGAVLKTAIEARCIVTSRVLHRANLIERPGECVVQVELQTMPAPVPKRNDHGMIVRPVAVGSDEEVQDLQVVIGGRERQSKSSKSRRQSPQEIHRQKERGNQA